MELTYSGKKELITNLLEWASEEPNSLAAKIFESDEVVNKIKSFLGLLEFSVGRGTRILVRTTNRLPYNADPGRGVGVRYNALEFRSGMTMRQLQDQISRLVGAEGSPDKWEIA